MKSIAGTVMKISGGLLLLGSIGQFGAAIAALFDNSGKFGAALVSFVFAAVAGVAGILLALGFERWEGEQ